MKHQSRRSLMKQLLGGTALLPLLPRLDAWAGARPIPRRLLLVFSGNGVVPDRWWPQKTPDGFRFAAGSSLEPLTPFKDDLLIIRGLNRKLHPLGGAHERAMGGLWTGTRLNRGNQFGGGGWPSGPSVDQIIARALPPVTDFASLEVGVQPFGPNVEGGTMQHMCYVESNRPLPPEGSPYRLFDRLFGSDSLGNPASFANVRASRRSVLDLMKSEMARLGQAVAPADRVKIESHLEGVRSIERRLDGSGLSDCRIYQPGQPIDVDANENFPLVLKLQTDLLVSALACDRTRVASLQWSRSFSMVRHTWLGSSQGHHTLSHERSEWPVLTAINRWYAEQFAYLLAALKRVPEGDGTLLDHTLVVYCNELHTGWDHKPGPTPAVLAGRLGGAVRTGRYLDYGSDSPHSHNNLLVTLCHAMGLPHVARVGDLGTPGPLPGVLS